TSSSESSIRRTRSDFGIVPCTGAQRGPLPQRRCHGVNSFVAVGAATTVCPCLWHCPEPDTLAATGCSDARAFPVFAPGASPAPCNQKVRGMGKRVYTEGCD